MLSNAYFLAKFRFDKAENEPAKNLQNFVKINFAKYFAGQGRLAGQGNRYAPSAGSADPVLLAVRFGLSPSGLFGWYRFFSLSEAPSRRNKARRFSAVSTPILQLNVAAFVKLSRLSLHHSRFNQIVFRTCTPFISQFSTQCRQTS